MSLRVPESLVERLEIVEALTEEAERPPDRLPSRVAENAASQHASQYADRAEGAWVAGFEPAQQEIVWMPKRRFRYRPLSAVPLLERVLLRALAGDLGREVESLDEYRDTRDSFESDMLNDSDLEYFVLADVASFYRYVSHAHLERRITEATGRADLATTTRQLLGTMMGEETGLPQNVGPSDQFADLLIAPVERRMVRAGITTSRYNDDFRFGTESLTDAREALEMLQSELHRLGLTVNDGKTVIMRRERYAEHVETQLVEDYVAEDDLETASAHDVEETVSALRGALRRRRRTRLEEVQATVQIRTALRRLMAWSDAAALSRGRAIVNTHPSLTQNYARYLARLASSNQSDDVLAYLERIFPDLNITPWQELWLLEPVIEAEHSLGKNLGMWVDRLVTHHGTPAVLRGRAALAAARSNRLDKEQAGRFVNELPPVAQPDAIAAFADAGGELSALGGLAEPELAAWIYEAEEENSDSDAR